MVRHILSDHIHALLCEDRDPHSACLGVGFTAPYLSAFKTCAGQIVTLVPKALGIAPAATVGEPAVPNEESTLPFGEACFDRVILIHALEAAESARTLLRQVWRVLTPEGRLFLVVPNRVSLWAMMDVSPFACGRPYRKSELSMLLRDTLFEPLSWRRALYMPPRSGRNPVFASTLWESVGPRFFPSLGGVHIAAAKKSLYGVTPLPEAQKSHAQLVHA
ncbi:MAG: methyltransferase domain-containing protein [Rhizomicrobium sp.]